MSVEQRDSSGIGFDSVATAPYGIFVLRVAIGIDWIAHAFLKTWRGMNTHEALLAKNGITPLLAWPTFGLEVIGGLAILLVHPPMGGIPADLPGGRGLDQMAGRLDLFQHRRRLGISVVLADCAAGPGVRRKRRLRPAEDARRGIIRPPPATGRSPSLPGF